jgi:hypothetical protein
MSSGHLAEPYIIGFSIFLVGTSYNCLFICIDKRSKLELSFALPFISVQQIYSAIINYAGAVTSFMKLWPSLVPYEYGFRVILFTYCLIIVLGYRMGNPIRTAMDRLYSIAIGAFIAVLVNVTICPIWAGEQLHKELVNNFNSLADSLEGFALVHKILFLSQSRMRSYNTTFCFLLL